MKYHAHKDNLYKMRMLLRIQMNPSFYNIFRYDLTKKFYADLRAITHPSRAFRTNTVINLSGATGTGKSNVMMSLGKNCFPNFSHKNVFFIDQDILDQAKNFQPDSLLIRDENPAKSIFGLGSVRQSSQLGVMVETVRKFGLSFAFVEPSFVHDDISKILLETVDMDIDQRITRVAIKDAYTLKYMGAIYVKVLPEDDSDWIAYNERKDKFIDDIRQGKLEGAKLDYDKCVDRVIEKCTDEYRNRKERKALVRSLFPTYTNGEVDLIATLLEIRMRQTDGDG